jgi:hypothetical protein
MPERRDARVRASWVAAAIAFGGYWLAGSEVSDLEALAIVWTTFGGALGVLLLLQERFPPPELLDGADAGAHEHGEDRR